MLEMILFLWLVPLAFAIVALARLAEGCPPFTEGESELLFGNQSEIDWSPWLVIGFLALAVIFFGIGFFEGLVVINFASFWIVAAPLMTGVAAIFALARCLGAASGKSRIAVRDHLPSRSRESHQPDLFSR